MELQEEKKKEERPIPSSTLDIVIGPNQYTIKRPTVGQIIDMERAKLKLSGGQHSQMLFGTLQAQQAYLFVEAIATFTVLVPELQKDLLVKSLLDLTQEQSRPLVKQYEDKVYPWLNALREVASKG